jgi:drug/metabolite transporter (DMT)-like permease
VIYLVKNPLWLFGWVGLVGSLIFQALALHFGPLATVQPVLIVELVFALGLRRLWLRQSIRSLTWTAAVVTVMGLVIFLAVASPTGSPHTPTLNSWLLAIAISTVAIIVLSISGQFGSPSRRAALLATATSISWALEACFIKATTDSFSPHGLCGALQRWPIYAFVLCGIAGLLLEQSTLHVGPLKISLPFIVILDPIASIALGVALYREHFATPTWGIAVGAAAFIVTAVAVTVMTQTSPASMDQELGRL